MGYDAGIESGTAWEVVWDGTEVGLGDGTAP